MPDLSLHSQQLFYTIEVVDEAISQWDQVSFTYNSCGIDKKLHSRREGSGNIREYIVNPYQIAAANGRYYPICNYDKYENVANYRLDRITNIKLLQTFAKPMEKVKGLESGFDLPKYMAEHIYMFAGESGVETFQAQKYLLDDLVNWFGGGITFLMRQTKKSAPMCVNFAAMRRWALQYALHANAIAGTAGRAGAGGP